MFFPTLYELWSMFVTTFGWREAIYMGFVSLCLLGVFWCLGLFDENSPLRLKNYFSHTVSPRETVQGSDRAANAKSRREGAE